MATITEQMFNAFNDVVKFEPRLTELPPFHGQG